MAFIPIIYFICTLFWRVAKVKGPTVRSSSVTGLLPKEHFIDRLNAALGLELQKTMEGSNDRMGKQLGKMSSSSRAFLLSCAPSRVRRLQQKLAQNVWCCFRDKCRKKKKTWSDMK